MNLTANRPNAKTFGILLTQLGSYFKASLTYRSVCDPYQPLEAKFEITRSGLKQLVKQPFAINIQTKSVLVLRDVDLLQDFKTYAFIGPLLPRNASRLVARLEGKVDRILIDRMNYMPGIRGFYLKQGIQETASDDFFRKYKQSLILEMKKRNMDYEVLF